MPHNRHAKCAGRCTCGLARQLGWCSWWAQFRKGATKAGVAVVEGPMVEQVATEVEAGVRAAAEVATEAEAVV